ncbi:predicted protein [Lichtheimia corymbifera JMRC:FSU:9682]|uniref:Uncharacterized protein n=1 Tax=Lichtheimia corymbifera JMRC:FSU:9682 TaxID=1263082 RepID=A0A068RU11_9FUNG|nr:predicted protein [Lichtheimia corymbifera JMRC:FSU:9682]
MNNDTIHASLMTRAVAAAETTSLASFMADRDVKLSWIAFFALWIFWCLLWFLRHVFGDGHQGADYAGREEGDAVANRPWIRHPLAIATHSRLSRATDVLRDLVLMLFSMLALNTLARGVQRQVMILCWV